MKEFFRNTWKHRAHVVLALPVFLILFFIMYVPMTGLILAFKNYNFTDGIYRSPWADMYGFYNFKSLLVSKDIFFRMTRNTVLYYLLFTAVGTFLNVTLAIAIDQFVFKKVAKTMQTLMIVPVFISYAAVTFIVAAIVSDNGPLVHLFPALQGVASVETGAQNWPWILLITKIWKDTGYGSVLYMSVLAGVDSELYEAAEIDGANKWRRIWHITLPSLIPMITVMLLLSVGNVMRSDTGLFYQVTRNVGKLYPYTQVIDSYILNQIKTGSNFGFTGAASLFQSVVGLLLMLFANWMVKKIEPENALF